MRNIFKFAVLFLLCLVAESFATYVAVLETISGEGVLGLSERMYLTDKLREIASRTLPAYMDYTIMTRENINAMLPPGKTIEDCEGSCLAETGRNIAADYVAQGRIGTFGQQLTLTVELYESGSSKLVGSFTARKPDPEGLIEEIENNASELFERVKGSPLGALVPPQEDFRSYMVEVNTDPLGSVISVDGKPQSSCMSTPCNVSLTPGMHRFSFAQENYKSLDTVIDVRFMGQKVWASLEANYGTIIVEPQYPGSYGSPQDLRVTVNGKVQSGTKFRLAAGTYKIGVSHRCYETRESTVNVAVGSKMKFSKELTVAMAGISIESAENGTWDEPASVFVDGKLVGTTPYTGQVPVCAKIQMGEKRETMVTKLKAGETSHYIYKSSSYRSVYENSHMDAPEKASSFGRSRAPRDTIGHETKLLFGMSLGTLSYTANGMDDDGLDFKFTTGFEMDLASSRRFVFGLGLAMSFETQNIEYRGGSYSYYSPSNSEDYTLINLEVFTTLGLGWAGFKFFARPGVVINVDERDNSNYDFYVSKNTVAGMFETGFRFARNHEFLIAWQSGIISDIGIYVTTERSLFIGYRYVPTVGRKAF